MPIAEPPLTRAAAAALAVLFSAAANADSLPFDAATALRVMAHRPAITAAAHVEPSEAVVGQPCSVIVELTMDKGHGLEDVAIVNGLPKAETEAVYSQIENLPDARSTDGKVVKRFRVPARFTAPRDGDVSISVRCASATRVQTGNMSFTTRNESDVKTPPFRIKVNPLPEKGRPPAFAGAVGADFRLTQTLSSSRVHVGDIVTATYRLDHDGYFPSNSIPIVEDLSREFKAYDVKQTEYGPRHAAWTQILVPRTTEATNTAAVALYFYNVQTKRYEVVRTLPRTLEFISAAAATTNNVSVVVAAERDGDVAPPPADAAAEADGKANAAVELRLAPSDASPVIARLPPGAPTKEVGRHRSWRRLESARATGWTK